ncbi:MAG: OsmC family protein [Syntrophobacteraceae bacterium]
MVVCSGGEEAFCSFVSDGRHEIACDIPPEKGGKDAGFLPIDLLEAGLAACINITLRAYAESRKMKLSDAVVRVSMDKEDPEQVFVKEQIELIGDLTEKERKTLLHVASQCLVTKTLLKKFTFDIEEAFSTSTIKA